MLGLRTHTPLGAQTTLDGHARAVTAGRRGTRGLLQECLDCKLTYQGQCYHCAAFGRAASALYSRCAWTAAVLHAAQHRYREAVISNVVMMSQLHENDTGPFQCRWASTPGGKLVSTFSTEPIC